MKDPHIRCKNNPLNEIEEHNKINDSIMMKRSAYEWRNRFQQKNN